MHTSTYVFLDESSKYCHVYALYQHNDTGGKEPNFNKPTSNKVHYVGKAGVVLVLNGPDSHVVHRLAHTMLPTTVIKAVISCLLHQCGVLLPGFRGLLACRRL